MNRSHAFDPRALLGGAAAFALLLASGAAFAPGAEAAFVQDGEDEDEEENDRTFSSAVGEIFIEARDQSEAEDYQGAIETIGRALERAENEYETSTLYRFRASMHFELDNIDQTIADFEASINAGGLRDEEIRDTRINLGQLLLAQERIDEGLEQFELALEAGAELNTRLAKVLAQGYAAADRWSEGVEYAERWYDGEDDKSLSDYQLMLAYYNELERSDDQLEVVRDQLNDYPEEESGWQNLIAIFARQEREEEAFEANKLMYLNGLFEEERQLINLAQYYSYFENPYRGAQLLEREMNAGRVETNQENLRLLSNMWRQAAEFDNAIPVLEQIAERAGDGQTALQLAEAHYQLNDFDSAETWFVEALDRGGLEQPGEAWVLLGTVRFNEQDLDGALEAFRSGREYAAARSSADGWIQYVEGTIESGERRELQREQVRIDECRLTVEAEQRIATVVGEADDEGRVRISLPERCQEYFNQYGQQYREAGWTDEEAEERRQALSAGEADEVGGEEEAEAPAEG